MPLSLPWDKSIKIDGEYLLHQFYFTDVIVFITDNLGDAQQILSDLKEVTASVDLNINFHKTKFMINLIPNNKMQIRVEQVSEYKYLGDGIKVGSQPNILNWIFPKFMLDRIQWTVPYI